MNLLKNTALLCLLGSMFNVSGQSKPNLKVSGGNDYSVGICADGSVKAWGSNAVNQIPGFAGAFTDQPTNVVGLPAILSVDAGSGSHAVALTCDGAVWGWGRNDLGQLGDGTYNTTAVPVQTVGIGGVGFLTDVTLVSGGTDESFAITSDARCVAWGQNDYGQLGDGTTIGRNVPGYVRTRWNETTQSIVPAMDLQNVLQVEAGDQSGIALADQDGDGSGVVYSWGENGIDAGVPIGRQGANYLYAMPVLTASGLPLDNIVQVSSGDQHGLALDANGNVWAWGGDWGRGQVGDGPTYYFLQYASQVVGGQSGDAFLGDSDPVISISAGQAHSIACTQSGALYSWGANGIWQGATVTPGGQLGIGNVLMTAAAIEMDNSLSSSPVQGLVSAGTPITDIVSVSDGDGWSFAVSSDNTIYVAGYNANGELGLDDGSYANQVYFVPMSLGCTLDVECPDPNFGSDIEVCTGFAAFDLMVNNTSPDFSYEWYKDNVLLPGETSPSLSITDVGVYHVLVNDGRSSFPCVPCSGTDTVEVLYPAAPFSDPGGLTYCGTTLSTANVVGTGNFEWYAQSSGGPSLAQSSNSGNIDSPIAVAGLNSVTGTQKEIFVEDVSSFSTTVATDAEITSSSLRDWQETSDNRLSFTISESVTILQMSAFVRGYGGTVNASIVVYNSSNTELGRADSTSNHNGSQYFDMNFSGGLTLSPGTYYLLTTGIQAYNTVGNAYQSYGPLSHPSLITFNDNGTDQSSFIGVMDWDVEVGNSYQCGRLRVLLDESCTCPNDPQSASLTPAGPLTVCSGPVNLQASSTGTAPVGGYNYEFRSMPGDVVVQAASSTSSYSASASGSYYVVITDPADPVNCVAQSSTVSVTIDTPPTTSVAGSDQTICADQISLSANSPAVGTGAWTVISGSASIVSLGSATSQVNNLSPGANTFRWTISNGSCPDSESDVTITMDENPSTSVAGNNQTICSTTANLAATTPTVGSGAWSVISGGASVLNPTQASSGVSNLAVGSNTFRWTNSNGVCPVETADVTITRDEAPSTAVAGSDQVLCSQSASLAANVPGVGTGVWTVLSGGGTLSSSSTPNSNVSLLAVGANVFRWTISNGVCPDEVSEVTITRDEEPSDPDAGSNQVICADNGTLEAVLASVGVGSWSVLSGAGVVTSPLVANSTVTGLSVGPNSLRWTISNGVCTDKTADVTITRDELPSNADAGTDQTICADQTTLSAFNPSAGTGEWSVISGSGSFSSLNDPQAVVSGLAVGQHELRWTVSNGVCPTNEDEVIITVDGVATVADAGGDTSICDSQYNLEGNTAATGTGQWTLVSGSGNFVDPSDASTLVSGLSYGANVFRWTINNGTCPPTQSDVTITRDEEPQAPFAGTDTTVCVTSCPIQATPANVGQGLWTVVVGAGIVTPPTSPLAVISDMSIGENRLRWEVTNGTCPAISDEVIIYVDATPSQADAGPDQTVCQENVAMAATVPLVGVGQWSVVSGSPSIGDFFDENSNVSVAAGVHALQWVVSNGVCPSSLDTVIIARDEDPSQAIVGPGGNVCVADPIVLSANSPFVGTGTWLVGASTTGGVISDVTDPNSIVNGMVAGDVIQAVWQVVNGVCPLTSDTLVLEANGIADPSIVLSVSSTTLCLGDTLDLTALVSNQGTAPVYEFYDVDGVLLSSGSNPNYSFVPTQTQSYYATLLSNSNCLSGNPLAVSDTLAVQIDFLPTSSVAGNDQLICQSNWNLDGVVPSVGNGSWTGPVTFADNADPKSAISGIVDGMNTLVWEISNGVCPPSRDEVIITKAPDLTVPDVAAQSGTLCESDASPRLMGAAVNATAVPSELGVWQDVNNLGGNQTGADFQVSTLTNGLYPFVYEISNGVCPSLTDTVMLQIDQVPSMAQIVNSNPVEICADSVNLSAVEPTVGVGNWVVPNELASMPLAQNSIHISGLVNTGHYVVWEVSNGVCPITVDSVLVRSIDGLVPEITIDPIPAVCEGSSILGTTNYSAGGNNPVFAWALAGQSTGLDQDAVTATPISSGWLKVAMTSSESCVVTQIASDSIWVDVSIPPSPLVQQSEDSICEGGIVVLSVTNTSGSLSWYKEGESLSLGSTNSISVTESGSYFVEEDHAVCPSVSSSVLEVTVLSYPYVEAGDNLEIEIGEVVFLDGESSVTPVLWTSDQWALDKPSELDASSEPTVGGKYFYFLSASNGECESVDSMQVTVVLPIKFPNVITPNGDGINDEFRIQGIETYSSARLLVFNRWGNLVYERFRPHVSWWDGTYNGKQLPVGTYYFVLELLDEKQETFNGDVTLMR